MVRMLIKTWFSSAFVNVSQMLGNQQKLLTAVEGKMLSGRRTRK